ncbi:MAG TPA: cation-translocating P-type ATPase [Gaiellaceae bacterium]|nr:cation-translocating P-type ATPase [Gaiellaceae bacterium]
MDPTTSVSDEAPRPAADWHARDVEDVAALLGSSGEQGLGEAEAGRRLAADGPNELEAGGRPFAWRLLLDQFRNALIVILLVGAALSAALGHETESLVIAVIVVFAAVLGFVQEYRAERALEALRRLASPTATVVRDGRERRIPAAELVRGDLVLLAAGDRVPADARVCAAFNLSLEEAALTGESLPAEKTAAALSPGPAMLGDRTNMVYAGTTVVSGRGRALVVATGARTEFGAIAHMLATIERPRTPLQQSLDRTGVVLARAALAVVVVIVALGLLRGEPFLEMLVFGVAVAVAVVPEALPAVVTISLSLAAVRMSRRNALVRRLPAVETLGGVSVIGSDKTGTLTANRMTVRCAWVAGRTVDLTEPRSGSCDDLERLFAGAVLASDARLERADDGEREVRGDPTETALVVAAAKLGVDPEALAGAYVRVAEIPFTAERKRMTTIHDGPEGFVAYTKGAPEVVLPLCSRWLSPDGEQALGPARGAALERAHELAARSLRVLAVARRQGADPAAETESGLTLLGLVAMLDPPRPEAREAIATCRRAGIRPVMITGDHPLTARSIASEIGLLESGAVVTGADLDALTDRELERDVESIDVYARVSPAHKLRVVKALQARGHSVAMTGDGVNDAPALKRADIGVAMGLNGTDVTREAADMTLLDDNFQSIVAAVEEGRGVYANVRKYLMYLLSANLGEIGLLAVAALAGKPLPLTAVQILYVNLATDGLPALALAVDPAERDLMRRRPRRRDGAILTRPVVGLITLGGAWSTTVTVALFTWALSTGEGLDRARTTVFAALILIELFKAFAFRSDRRSTFESPLSNRWLDLAVAWEIGLLVTIVNVPFLEHALGTTDLPARRWLVVAAAAFTIVPVLELGKFVARRREHRGSP